MDFDLNITRPDYSGGSIVNLMATIKAHFCTPDRYYRELQFLQASALAGKKRVILLVIDGLGADLLDAFTNHAKQGYFKQHQLARAYRA